MRSGTGRATRRSHCFSGSTTPNHALPTIWSDALEAGDLRHTATHSQDECLGKYLSRPLTDVLHPRCSISSVPAGQTPLGGATPTTVYMTMAPELSWVRRPSPLAVSQQRATARQHSCNLSLDCFLTQEASPLLSYVLGKHLHF